jgi:hypothetical protein
MVNAYIFVLPDKSNVIANVLIRRSMKITVVDAAENAPAAKIACPVYAFAPSDTLIVQVSALI